MHRISGCFIFHDQIAHWCEHIAIKASNEDGAKGSTGHNNVLQRSYFTRSNATFREHWRISDILCIKKTAGEHPKFTKFVVLLME